MRNLLIKVIGVLLLITFLIYLFYSPRLKFDVLENPNKKAPTKTEQVQKIIINLKILNLKQE